jgi:hypothetical protein
VTGSSARQAKRRRLRLREKVPTKLSIVNVFIIGRPVKRIGSRSLGEFSLAVVRIECPRCDRAGSYRLDGLMARFCGDIAQPDLFMALATCERRRDFSKPCGARFTDLA